MTYTYQTEGTCAAEISFELIDGKVHNVRFLNGCQGNLQAIGRLVEGLSPEEIAARCQGICCGAKPTSCSDQLALAVLSARAQETD